MYATATKHDITHAGQRDEHFLQRPSHWQAQARAKAHPLRFHDKRVVCAPLVRVLSEECRINRGGSACLLVRVLAEECRLNRGGVLAESVLLRVWGRELARKHEPNILFHNKTRRVYRTLSKYAPGDEREQREEWNPKKGLAAS